MKRLLFLIILIAFTAISFSSCVGVNQEPTTEVSDSLNWAQFDSVDSTVTLPADTFLVPIK